MPHWEIENPRRKLCPAFGGVRVPLAGAPRDGDAQGPALAAAAAVAHKSGQDRYDFAVPSAGAEPLEPAFGHTGPGPRTSSADWGDVVAFAGIFDGHGRCPDVSECARVHLLADTLAARSSTASLEDAVKIGFAKVQERVSEPTGCCGMRPPPHAGSTATAVFVQRVEASESDGGTRLELVVAWVGDSRAVLLSPLESDDLSVDGGGAWSGGGRKAVGTGADSRRSSKDASDRSGLDGTADTAFSTDTMGQQSSTILTVDHSPGINAAETERVTAAGGQIGRIMTDHGPVGPIRVYPGGLAVTRALGNIVTTGTVLNEPEIMRVPLPLGTGERRTAADEAGDGSEPLTQRQRLVVASDGVWNAVDMHAFDAIAHYGNVEDAAQRVLDASIARRGVHDDITVLVVDLMAPGYDGTAARPPVRHVRNALTKFKYSAKRPENTRVAIVQSAPLDATWRGSKHDRANETHTETQAAEIGAHEATELAGASYDGDNPSTHSIVSDDTVHDGMHRMGLAMSDLEEDLEAAELRGLFESGTHLFEEEPSRKLGPPGALADTYELGEEISSAMYGVVRHATHRESGERVAVKSVIVTNDRAKQHRDELDTLVGVSSHGRHRNLPRVLATYEDGGALHIVTELCDGGTLLSHIGGNETEHTSRRVGPGGSFESSRSSSFSVERGSHSLTGGDSQRSSGTSHNEARLAHLFAQLLDAVRHLHDEMGATPIVHRAIHPQNVLMRSRQSSGDHASDGAGNVSSSGGDDSIVLVDFGCATFLPRRERLRDCEGNRFYAAPEVVNIGDTGYGTKADVWSCGVMLWVMLAGIPPESEKGMVWRELQSGNLPASTPACSAELRALLSRLLCRNEAKRPTARQALEHPWFRVNGVKLTPVRGEDGNGDGQQASPKVGITMVPSVGASLNHTVRRIRDSSAAHAWSKAVLEDMRRHLTQHEKRRLIRLLEEEGRGHRDDSLRGGTMHSVPAATLETALMTLNLHEMHARSDGNFDSGGADFPGVVRFAALSHLVHSHKARIALHASLYASENGVKMRAADVGRPSPERPAPGGSKSKSSCAIQ